LRKAGIVNDRRDGNRIYYSLNDPENEPAGFRAYLEELQNSEHPDLQRLEEVLAARTATAQTFADTTAAQWDDIGQTLHSRTAALLAVANTFPRDFTIADLGTGTGLLLPLLSTMCDKVYAVDQSAAMLRRARARCRQSGLQNITFIQHSLESLEGELPPCNALLLHFVLHQIARPPALLKQLVSRLKTGGRLVVVDRVKHRDEQAKELYGSLWLGFDQEQLEEWFREAGMQHTYWHVLSEPDLGGDITFPIFVAAASRE
jgi:ArsR family transcriptional regulator